MEYTVILLLCVGGVFLVGGNPVSEGDVVHQHSNRVKRAPGDTERDCTASPPYTPPTAKDTTELLRLLRQEMQSSAHFAGSIQAYIIPAGDAHLSEYISNRDERRAFISGFLGSAGTAVVTNDGSGGGKAALWTDSRYYLQGEQQLDCNWILMKQNEEGVPTIEDWLVSELGPGGRVGVDPYLVSISTWEAWEKALTDARIRMFGVPQNLVDGLWDDRPGPSTAPLIPLGIQYTGKSWEDKFQDVREKMQEKDADAIVLTKLDEVAWLMNLRGSDVPYNPVFFAYAILTTNDALLYLDQNKVTTEVRSHLRLGCTTGVSCVQVEPYDNLLSAVEGLAADGNIRKIWISSASTTYAVYSKVPEGKQLLDASPLMRMKGKKNAVEQQGLKNAHIRDAVAKCEFLMWLENEVPGGSVTEISASDYLQELRSKQHDYMGLSFAAISASGPNGAVVHYRPTEETNRPITTTDVYLIDSGGQYRDGTTDVTRTVHYGEPTDYQRETYTLVLMGAINEFLQVFKQGTFGIRLDQAARAPLFSYGLEYGHGTGHGLGSFLNVHEAPRFAHTSGVPVGEEGTFITIEPGYYEDGQFGIRLETLAMVKQADTKYHFQGRNYLTFEPITLVPFQEKMMKLDMMNDQQLTWLNNYYILVREKIGPELQRQGKNDVYDWLMQNTKPIAGVRTTSGASSVSSVWFIVSVVVCIVFSL